MSREDIPWIKFEGERCPVEAGTVVDVKYRDKGIAYGVKALEPTGRYRDADARFWVTSDLHHSDIVAYRVAPLPTPSPQ